MEASVVGLDLAEDGRVLGDESQRGGREGEGEIMFHFRPLRTPLSKRCSAHPRPPLPSTSA